MGGEFPNSLPQPPVSRTSLSLSEEGESSGLARGCWRLPTTHGFNSELKSSFQPAVPPPRPREVFLLSLLSIHRWQQALKSLTSQYCRFFRSSGSWVMISPALVRGAAVRGMNCFQGTKHPLQLFAELLCEDKQQKVKLRGKKGQLSTYFGPTHPCKDQ